MAILSEEDRKRLIDALGESQRIGMLGDRPVAEVVDHSLPYADLIPAGAQTVIDLGSGGGDPGLVIAMARPDLRVTLVDRRTKRTDLLVRLVGLEGLPQVGDLLGRRLGRIVRHVILLDETVRLAETSPARAS